MSHRPRAIACWASLALGLAVGACTGPKDAPRHAFLQIARALETRDRALFHEYVDVENVVATGLDAVLRRQFRKDEALKEAGAFATGLVQATRPMLALLVRTKLDEAIEDPKGPLSPRHGRIVDVRKDGIHGP